MFFTGAAMKNLIVAVLLGFVAVILFPFIQYIGFLMGQ